MLFKKETKDIEKYPIDVEIESLIESLKSYSGDTEDYTNAVKNIEKLVEIRNEIYGKKVKADKEKIGERLFNVITDPKLIASIIVTGGQIWWGLSCMNFELNGNIPPLRMFANGPKFPKAL